MLDERIERIGIVQHAFAFRAAKQRDCRDRYEVAALLITKQVFLHQFIEQSSRRAMRRAELTDVRRP